MGRILRRVALVVGRALIGVLAVLAVLAVLVGAARGDDRPLDVGDSRAALPGIVRIPVAGNDGRLGLGAAATACYGFTESGVSREANHRLLGDLAASYRAIDWLSFGLRFGGRYDWHPSGNGGGAVGEPGFSLRAGTNAGDFAFGAE